VVAKVELTLSGVPEFRGIDDPAKLSGRIHIGPEIDYLERAFDASKYGEFSREPYLDIAFPSPDVMSIHVQFVPYKLKESREELAAVVIKQLENYAPGIKDLIVGTEVITPRDLEETYGSRDRLGAISDAIQTTLPVRRGHASGRWHHGLAGRERGA
jgi:phytoene dehydrogenase-like protein